MGSFLTTKARPHKQKVSGPRAPWFGPRPLSGIVTTVFANDERPRVGVVPRVCLLAAPEDGPLAGGIAGFLGPFPVPVSVTPQAIVPGARWDSRLVTGAAEATHVYLFWSAHAARLAQLADDADRAIGAGRVVVPVRLDATELPRHLAAWKCIDARFVAGPNGEHYDGGFTSRCVADGKALLTRLGVPISQTLGEAPWPRTPTQGPDGYAATDPRLLAVALCAALR